MKKIILFIIVFFISCFLLEAQVKVVAPINPNAPTDNYPTHIDSLGHGGFISVKNTTIRNSISTLRRKEGMLVYVVQTDSLYQLKGGITNANWTAFKLGSANGIIWFGALATAPASPQLNWGYYNSTDKKSYLYCNDNNNVLGWQVIATNNSSSTALFTDSVFVQGGTQIGPESLISSTLISTKLETREYMLDAQQDSRPRFRRYVLGLDNKGMIALVRPHIQMYTISAEWDAPLGYTIPANGERDIDVEFTVIKPQIGALEELPISFKNLDISAGPFVSPRVTNLNYDPQSPPSSTAVGFPSGIIIAWSTIINGISTSPLTGMAARYARVRLRNLTGSVVTIPLGFQILVTAFAVEEGTGAIYESDYPVGG